ncbi:MAG: hypothetical protein QOI47_723 [Actinomycetota bacterium]|nr:hypothetical protein [Actinomycetota bacterium]
MPAAIPDLSADVLTIRPWPDEVIDAVGHDPRSAYVERFWLGVLGPSTIWLLRRLAAGLESSPAGFDLRLADAARAIGLSGQGQSSSFARTIGRVVQFDLARIELPSAIAVRRKLPPLARRHLARLPESLQEEHRVWQEAELRVPELERQRRRARKLAMSLVALGEDLEATERQLMRWKYHPSLCRESALWAWREHAQAHAAAADELEPDPPRAA